MTPGTVLDHFSGPAGSPPDPTLWGYDLGPYQDAGLQTYTNDRRNVRLDGQGHLVIQAWEAAGGYTSARPVTKGRLSMLYGTISARIKLPAGQGIWPAFWMMGTNYDLAGWPQCGEIDIIETVNAASTYHVTLHGPQGNTDYFGGVESGKVVGTSGHMGDLSDDFHDYWVRWQPNRITVGIDTTAVGEFTPESLPAGGEWVFDRPMYALLDIAVGGSWPGPPDPTTAFPATMEIDWFRYSPA